MLFKEYVQNLSIKQTFQLYTLIAIFILYPYFKFVDNKQEKISNNQNVSTFKQNISKLNEKLKTPDFINVLKDFENESKKYESLKTINFKLNKKHITIQGDSTQSDLLKYLLFCENYSFTSRLNSFSLKPKLNSKLISFSFDIEFKNTYSKKISNKELIKKYNLISSLDDEPKQKSFILQGIIEEFVILDNKLFTVGNYFGEYKIEKINKNSVVLTNNNIEKVLYLKEQ